MAFMKREKAYWKTWHQPILTSNGTMGGDSFAVSSNVVQYGSSDCVVYMAFDDKTNTQFHSTSGVLTGYIDWYNPKPLKITNIQITNQNSYDSRASTAGNIYGSNNGTDWTLLTSYTYNTSLGQKWNIDLSSNTQAFLYYRLESTAGGSGGYWTIQEIDITAKVYDEYYTYKAYNIMRRNREYFKYSTWNQPILTSNTSYGAITASSDHSTDTSEPWQIFHMGATVGNRFLFTGTSSEWIKWQLPEPIKISSCTVYNSAETSYLNRFPKSITLQVSDDGSSWKTIGSASGYTQPGNSESHSFTCNSDRAYSYIRWQFAQTFGASPMAVGVIKINAKKVSAGTSSDYDFYKDSYKTYNIINPSWESGSQTFNYTGTLQTYTVPEGVTSVKVDCVGAKGYTASLEGGLGGRVKCNLSVTPGQTFYVWVANAHSNITTPEYNASDIRTSSADITSTDGLNSRLIVAGGGGDGSQTNHGGGKGGHGGGLIGGSGRDGYGTVATGGTQTAGGTGGTHGDAYGGGSGQGNSGTLGLGGATKAYGAGSGGCGGAGYYGGGGGSMCTVNKIASVNGVGGAGGSSYTHPDLCSEVKHAQGYQSGNGYVKISYKRRRF